MANDSNLKTLTPTEARKYGRMGGLASGRSRRERRDLRFALLALMEADMGNGQTGTEAMAATLFKQALHGDLAAIKYVNALALTAQNVEDAEAINLFLP